MIERIFDQRAVDQELGERVTFVGQLHAEFLKMLDDLAHETKADSFVISPAALAILQSGSLSNATGFQREHTSRLKDVVGTLSGRNLVIDVYRSDADPVDVKRGEDVVATVHLRNVSFV